MDFININSISTDEAKANMEKDKNIILLDVREDDEYRVCHIPGALNLSVNMLGGITDVVPDQQATIYVYCHSGVRSVRACQLLTLFGYTNAYDLGGIISWPYDVVVA